MKQNVGIYKITNLINGKVYIGQSSNLKLRFIDHKSKLKNGNHYNDRLRNSSKKHGFENFKFEVIEYTELSALTERENYWIEYYKSYERGIGYNLTKPSENKNLYLMTEDSRMKMRDSTIEYSEEFLLSELNRFYDENNRIPSCKDLLNRNGFPTSTTYMYRFGSLGEAIKLSGLMDKAENKNKYIGSVYDKERVKEKVCNFIEEKGDFPSDKDFINKNYDLPSKNVVVRLFGSMENLKKDLGYDSESIKQLERMIALDCLVKLYETNGRVTAKDIDKCKITRSKKYYNMNFGGILNACKMAGIPHIKSNN